MGAIQTERDELLKEVKKRQKRTALELGQLYIKNYVQHCRWMAEGDDDTDIYNQIRKALSSKASSRTNGLSEAEQALYHYMINDILDWQIKMHPYMLGNYTVCDYELVLFGVRLQYINFTEHRLDDLRGKKDALNRIIDIVEGDKVEASLKKELLSVTDSLRMGFDLDDKQERVDDSLSVYYPDEQGDSRWLENAKSRLNIIIKTIYYLKGFEKIIDLTIETFGCEDLEFFKPDIDSTIAHTRDANIQYEFLRDYVKRSGKDTNAVEDVLKALSRLYELTHTEDGVSLDRIAPPPDRIDRARQIIKECYAFTDEGEELENLMLYDVCL